MSSTIIVSLIPRLYFSKYFISMILGYFLYTSHMAASFPGPYGRADFNSTIGQQIGDRKRLDAIILVFLPSICIYTPRM